MASLSITRVLAATEGLVAYILVIFMIKSVTSVQAEKCIPTVDKVKHWVPVGGRFEANCTIVNCDAKFETQVWQRNGKRFRDYRSNQVVFSESKRLKLVIDPVEEGDEGLYSCHTKIHGHDQHVELIIGVEPTTTTTTTTTTPAITTQPLEPTIHPSDMSSTASAERTSIISTATTILKVTTTPIKIIKTTQMPVEFISKNSTDSGAHNSGQNISYLFVLTPVLIIAFSQTFRR